MGKEQKEPEETALAPDGEAKEKQAKKKRVIVTPPCPPAASTGYIILRGVLQGIVGASMDEAAVSPILLPVIANLKMNNE